jgi:hypothetical protein
VTRIDGWPDFWLTVGIAIEAFVLGVYVTNGDYYRMALPVIVLIAAFFLLFFWRPGGRS